MKNKNIENYFKKKDFTLLVINGLMIVLFFFYIGLGWSQTIRENSFITDALIKSIFVLFFAGFVKKIADFVFSKMVYGSARMLTVGAMVKSLVKYAVGVVSIIIILIIFLGEAYMTELFAGMGVFALIIGLGCQSLINDIVAGIFIVFEDNFQVGDVVVINGWSGKVLEVGLRTTIIQDVGGNKKIINNASINDFINNSRADSVVAITLGIEYDEDLVRVENIIKERLPLIKEENKLLLTAPEYKGVKSLSNSSVDLLVICTCKEEDKFQVERDLNREFKLLFDKNNINFPYPQLTVSSRVEKN